MIIRVGGVLDMKVIITPRCGYCQLVFHSSHLLHQHKEAAAHWTDDDFEEQTDTEDEEETTVNWDELERLLWREIFSEYKYSIYRGWTFVTSLFQ